MSDHVSLLIVLWVIYLFELVIWLPKNAVLFNFGSKKNPVFADTFPGNAAGSLRLNHIVPWFQLAIIVRQPLVAFSPEALSNQFLSKWTRTQKQYNNQSYSYSQIESVSIDGTKLALNRKTFVNCSTKKEAEHHRTVILNIIQTPQKERPQKILAYYQQRFHSVDSAAKQIKKVKRTTQNYRALSSFLFVYAFILCPSIYYLHPDSTLLLYFLLSCVFLGWVLSFMFHKVHCKLHPEETYPRFQSVLKQVFCFPIGIGAGKDLSLNMFAQYDPLLMAKCSLPASEFERFCQKIWLDLKYPIQTKKGIQNNIFIYAQTAYRDAAAIFLQNNGLHLHTLERPIEPLNSSSVCYCPRCHTQFQTERVHCTECPGILTRKAA